MDPAKRRLWKTRGIGAIRIGSIKANSEERLTWHKKLRQSANEAEVSWYVDASSMDAEDPATQCFGFGIVAVGPSGRLEAAASGTPPPHIRTIGQAEAYALSVVLRRTVQHKQIITDCLANLTILRKGFAAASSAGKRAARTWGSIKTAVDGDHATVKLI